MKVSPCNEELTLFCWFEMLVSPRPDDLLGSNGVSESNVFAYLAEVEKVW